MKFDDTKCGVGGIMRGSNKLVWSIKPGICGFFVCCCSVGTDAQVQAAEQASQEKIRELKDDEVRGLLSSGGSLTVLGAEVFAVALGDYEVEGGWLLPRTISTPCAIRVWSVVETPDGTMEVWGKDDMGTSLVCKLKLTCYVKGAASHQERRRGLFGIGSKNETVREPASILVERPNGVYVDGAMCYTVPGMDGIYYPIAEQALGHELFIHDTENVTPCINPDYCAFYDRGWQV